MTDAEFIQHLLKERNKRILLVEDDPFVRDILGIIAAKHVCEFSSVATGKEALESIKENPPDKLFLDIRLPDMDGVDVFQYALAMKPDLDVVFMSGFLDDLTRHRISEVGFALYLDKPPKLERLYKVFSTLSIPLKDGERMPSTSPFISTIQVE